jgi:ABC-2 type transport system permease protein
MLLALSVIAGYLMFTYYTYFLFDEVFFTEGLAMMGLYFLYLAFIMSVALFFSTISKSYLIAILPTFGVYLLVTILTILGEVPFFEYLPGMIIQSIIGVLYHVNETIDVIWNIVVTVAFIGLFLGGSIWKIQSIDVT